MTVEICSVGTKICPIANSQAAAASFKKAALPDTTDLTAHEAS